MTIGGEAVITFCIRTLSICDEKDSLSLSRIGRHLQNLLDIFGDFVHFEVIPNHEIWEVFLMYQYHSKRHGFVKFEMCTLLKAVALVKGATLSL